MSQKKGDGKPSFSGTSSSPAEGIGVNGKIFGGSGAGNRKVEVLQPGSNNVELSLDSGKNTEWEVVSRNKNRGGAAAPKQRGSRNSASTSWGPGKATGGARQDARPGGRGNTKSQSPNTGWEKNYMAQPPPAKIAPPLQHGWQWGARSVQVQPNAIKNVEGDIDSEDDEDMTEDSDDDIFSDGFDSDESQKRHDKKSKWFKNFFDILDKLSLEQTNSLLRQWHCPACRNGPGEIDWYNGLQALMAHAKTKGSRRVKLHREFAELLDEELSRKGTSVIPVGEVYGEWHGLRQSVPDKEIVWPPMVVVMNTQIAKDENEKWTGMGSTQLLGLFGAYNALKARHSYGPNGHRGISLLIFEDNPTGYVEAERLHNHFVKEGRDRDAWDHRRTLFHPGGLRILYGFTASKEDMDSFNYHTKDKSKLKFEMRSYEKMVVIPMKQMNEDNQQLKWLQIKAAKNQQHAKALEETVGVLSERLRKAAKENRIVRERTLLQYEQNKEELDQQEQFFKAQIEKIHQTLVEKERIFQEEQAECWQKQLNVVDSALHVNKEIEKFIESQSKGIDSFQAEKESLFQLHEEKKAELKHQRMQEDFDLQRKRLQEDVDLEKELDTLLTELMNRYSSQSS
ncbi:hypothetical protein MKW94_029137 [Papaver nudicaule]|uniref:Uncharacterized protein n=1 Tax=Papaver nudicaule TaxID=74823 RepID=A0AA41S495_PAPNU|nr:hypothetical protein [Papaver nudicaule]